MLHLLLAAAVQAASPGAATPASAQVPPAAPAALAPSAEGDKVICRRTANTGSRLGGSKECLTKAQWTDRDVQNAQMTRDMQARGFQRASPK